MFRDRRLRALDPLGLVSREPARILSSHRDRPEIGRELIADHVSARRPEVIVFWVGRDGGRHRSRHDPSYTFPLDVERHLFDRPELERDYLAWGAIDISEEDMPSRRLELAVFGRRDLPASYVFDA